MSIKLTTVLLIVSLVQVSAAGFAQKITFVKKDATLKQVFNEINKQTGYSILWTGKNADNKQRINADFRDTPLQEVLKRCLDDKALTYTIEDKSIVITANEGVSFRKTQSPADTSIRISGRVVNEKGEGMAGATIKVSGAPTIGVGSEGAFSMVVSAKKVVLVVSYVGYKTTEITVSGNKPDLVIRMEPEVGKLNAVTIVSTGYQDLPRERAAGSFSSVSNTLFNRTTSTNVLDRLDGVVPGLLFNKQIRGAGLNDITDVTIRGQSTLEANMQPLIIVDDFPYGGDINNINPNDIESVTVLKDAAAASIWGTRAGNGVIVFKTKKGNYDRPLQVSFNSNVTIAAKPDLNYVPMMTSSEFIDEEKYLFKQGVFDNNISNTFTYPLLSPVVDLLAQARAGTITQASADAQINAMRSNDVRKDFQKYIYKNAVNQQYSLSLNGGSKTATYLVSVGYDKDLHSYAGTKNDRLNLHSNLTFNPLPKLEINLGSTFTRANMNSLNPASSVVYTPGATLPYEMLAAPNGTPLVYGRDYLSSFAANPGDPRLLNWQFVPLQDIHDGYSKTTNYDLLFNAGAAYHISKVFTASVKYNYEKTIGNVNNYESPDSYYVRNLVNLYTQPDGSPVIRPIPLGGILGQTDNDYYSRVLRGQLNIDKTWNTNNELHVIAAAEVSENAAASHQFLTYGYDPKNLTSNGSINFNTLYAYSIPFLGSAYIPNLSSFNGSLNRFTSLLANAAYTFDQRYTLSASARKDASNLFGVTANNRGVPLYSVGFSWDIAKEPFYKLDILPALRLRATYGYNGNTAAGLSAYSVIAYSQSGNAPYTGVPYASILNPANNNLRWEKVGIMNLGVDFGFAGNRINGSFEYYTKNSTDLLWLSPTDPTTGFTYANSNSVNMNGKGIDIVLNSLNLKGPLRWNTTLLISRNTNKVTRFTPIYPLQAANYLNAGTGAPQPILGQTLYGVYAYKWAGLDHAAGNPQGYLNGAVSEDYYNITNAAPGTLQFFGSAVPTTFGSVTNTFSYKQFSVSANIKYAFGFFFRANSANYGSLFNDAPTSADFAQRWQKPGDETHTNVPSMVYPDDYYRDTFYANSSALIAKGDNIRLQDIVASYTISKPARYFKSLKIYVTAQNLGIIWKANKFGIDPDYGYSNFPQPKTISIGLNANF